MMIAAQRSSMTRAASASARRSTTNGASPPTSSACRLPQQQSAHNDSRKSAVVVVAAATTLAPGRRSSSSTATLVASSTFGRRLLVVQPRGVRVSPRRTRAVAVQANLFARISRLIKATLDNFLGTFEDPEKLLDRVVDEMTQDAARMRQAAAQAIASERQMQARAQTIQAAADQWLRRAELAVAAGQDELAREALTRRKAVQGDADRFRQQADAQKAACDQLQGSVRALEGKISEARNKKETLKARAASAKTSMAINDMVGGLKAYGQSSFAVFSKMEEKVMALEAEAQTTAALVAPDALEARFANLERGGVEDELRALKAGITSSSSVSASASAAANNRPRVDDVFVRVPSGAAIARAVDSQVERELEDLRRRARM